MSVAASSLLVLKPLSPELNPICYLLALLAHDFVHVSRIRVKPITIRPYGSKQYKMGYVEYI
jgi:hypothetical protein